MVSPQPVSDADLVASTMPEVALSPRLAAAIVNAYNSDGVTLSITGKSKTLTKFGHSYDIDNTGYKTVWEGTTINDEPPLFGDPTLGNVIDTISSADAGDTEQITIEGHTKSGDDLTFVIQTATLNGQNEVALSTPLHVASRAYCSSSTEVTGPVYIYDNTDGSTGGVPTDPSDVGLYLAGSADSHGQQSGNCFTAISSSDYWILTKLIVDVNRSGNGNYDVEFQVRSTTGVWRPLEVDIAVDTGATSFAYVNLDPAIVIPANSYVRALAQSNSSTDGEVSAELGGFLASVV